MKHLDLFSGYGGFTIPASKYGIKTIGFSEIDKYACSVLEYNFKGIKNYGDITKLKGENLPSVDIITGGSPCQDLSVAGKGAGLNAKRSGLFFHFIRLIKEIQPTYFIWENVKGAFSSQKGWDFARVQIEMEQAGYDVWWQTLNAKDFGVPQNRERIFAIGIRKGSGREILFEQRESRQNPKEDGAVIYRGRPNMPYEKGHRTLRYEKYDKNCPALTQNCAAGDQMNMVAIPNSNGNVHSLDANYWKGSNNPNKSRRSQIMVGSTQKHAAKMEDISPALTKAMGDGGGHIPMKIEDMRIRRLTPTECERLMGLEDGERCGIIRLWQQETKNFPTSKISANAERLNGEVVKPVGSAGRTESQENVPSAKKSSLSKSLKPKELVVLNVQVNSEKNSIKIWQNNNEEELLLDVSGVEKKRKFPNHNQIEDFVQMVVGLNTILWRETHNGKAESRVREQFLILQKNGVPVLNMYGINTMPPVRDVGKDLTTLNQHLKSIISLDSKIKNYEQNIQTLFFSAIPVITGFIPIKIEIENISEIKLSVLSGWTAKGIIDGKKVDISDTQRYKMCGNGVVTNCVDYIYSLIVEPSCLEWSVGNPDAPHRALLTNKSAL
jgi:DNA-cytosine methyltransferase